MVFPGEFISLFNHDSITHTMYYSSMQCAGTQLLTVLAGQRYEPPIYATELLLLAYRFSCNNTRLNVNLVPTSLLHNQK